MIRMCKSPFFKVVALFVALLLAGESAMLMAQTEPQPAAKAEPDPLLPRFTEARQAFFAGEYEKARDGLERLIADLAKIEGRETFKGEVFLLSGAAHEKLKNRDKSVEYFCQAKKLLGRDRSIEGLKLKKFKFYKIECPGAGDHVAKAGHKRGGIGKLLGTLLGLGVLAVAVWFLYTKVIKKDKDEYTVSSACFTTDWLVEASAQFSGATGDFDIQPQIAPNPNESNNWQDQVTYTISGYGNLISLDIVLSVTVSGGDNVTRHDLVYLDDVLIWDKTNTFTQPCSNRTVSDGFSHAFTKYHFGDTFTLKHQATFIVNEAQIRVPSAGRIKVSKKVVVDR